GMWGALNLVRSAASSIGAAVRGALPNSPAKYGPLSGKGYPLILGRNVSNFVARGIRDATPAVRMASKDLAGSVRSNLTSRAMGRDSAYSLGAQWVQSYADGIESQSARATKAVGTLLSSATGLDSEVSAALSADGFQSIPDQIADAMSGWECKQSRDATSYMYKRAEKSRSGAGRSQSGTWEPLLASRVILARITVCNSSRCGMMAFTRLSPVPSRSILLGLRTSVSSSGLMLPRRRSGRSVLRILASCPG